HGMHTGNIVPYASSAAWDSVGGRLHFLGGDHGEMYSFHVYYDEATNAWVQAGPTTFGGVHGYDHITIDTMGQQLYFYPYAQGTTVYRAPLPEGDAWSPAATWKPMTYVNITRGVTWFSGMNGAGPSGALAIYNCGDNGGEIVVYDPTKDQWFPNILGFG